MSPFSKKSQTFRSGQKSRETRTNMDIILSFLGKLLDKHDITLVHITYPSLGNVFSLLPALLYDALPQNSKYVGQAVGNKANDLMQYSVQNFRRARIALAFSFITDELYKEIHHLLVGV